MDTQTTIAGLQQSVQIWRGYLKIVKKLVYTLVTNFLCPDKKRKEQKGSKNTYHQSSGWIRK